MYQQYYVLSAEYSHMAVKQKSTVLQPYFSHERSNMNEEF